MLKKVFLLGAVGLLLGTGSALAAFPDIDLTTLGASYTGADGAHWAQLTSQPTGTGYYSPFLREQANGTEEAFNTDYRTGGGGGNAPLDGKNDPNYNHSFLLSELATTSKDFGGGAQDYYRFTLDINEPNSDPERYLSLDELRIYTHANATGGSLSTLAQVEAGALRYDMDAITDQTVYLDHDLTEGSGHDDMELFIPVSYFAGALPSDYVYFYAKFGMSGSGTGGTSNGLYSQDGFEEWKADFGTSKYNVPEPGTLALFGMALAGLATFRKRRTS